MDAGLTRGLRQCPAGTSPPRRILGVLPEGACPAFPRSIRLNSNSIAASSAASSERLLQKIRDALENLKALDIQMFDVHDKTSVTDWMVVASGTSSRHVKSIADEVERQVRQAGMQVIGTEGEREGEWVLVDLGDAVVHVMLPRVRDLYMLERLWGDGDQAASPDSGGNHGKSLPA